MTRTRLAYLAAGLTLILGLLSLFNPLLSARLLGFDLLEARGLSEIRATYGALFVALGAAMLWAAPTARRTTAWLRLPALLWVAAALGRVLSMSLDGAVTFGNLAMLALALLIGGSALAASFGGEGEGAPEARP